jgi:glycosyltransferase involved in cell wall biosynthesis
VDNIDNIITRITQLQKKYDLEYILVENGSKDESRVYFKENVEGKYLGIKVIYVDVNQGYGYGLQQGIKVADGEYIGWIHADLQMPPEELIQFFDEIDRKGENEKLFLKGIRTNRSVFDNFFTNGQSIFNTCLFGMKLYDVGAIPVLFHKSLLKDIKIDEMPNDFSIELYIYLEATKRDFDFFRFKVKLLTREQGKSSWNHGFKSKIKQSKRIFNDSMKIKKGEKVL